MKSVQLLSDVDEYRKGQVLTLSNKDADALIKGGLAELHIDHSTSTDYVMDQFENMEGYQDDAKELFSDSPVPPIPENLPGAIQDAMITVTAVKAVWINVRGQVVRKEPGEVFDMLPELADGLLTLGVVRQ